MQEIQVDKYLLKPLRSVRKDDIKSFLNNGKGVYMCNFPEPLWYEYHNFVEKAPGYIAKKKRMFSLLGKDSHMLSFTNTYDNPRKTKDFKNGAITHVGTMGFRGRIGQIMMTFKMIIWLTTHRKNFTYLLSYNFHFPMYFTAIFAKYVLDKELYVDFEDDYTLKERAGWKDKVFNFIKHTPDKVICINKHMEEHFKASGIDTYVFNGFIDLSYTKDIDFSFKDGMTFMYGGRLDEIRGAELIPELIYALRKIISNFEIIVTGAGSLEKEVRSWSLKELSFLGFLSEEDYKKQLNKSDAFLVLQKPDHPFSKGSYPSKVEYYANFKKPIYHLMMS